MTTQLIVDPYEAGPTACCAHPKVMAKIKKAIAGGHLLSAADVRLARHMGILRIPGVGRTGWNDGVIYPPTDAPAIRGPLLARVRASGLQSGLALSHTTGTLNALCLLVDFSDNPGTRPPAHFERLLFDLNNPNSMASFYRDLSYGKLTVTGTVTNWLRASQPYSFYTNGESGTGDRFPRNTPGLLEEILTLYCRDNSLALFDGNGDGYMDGLFLVHAGAGAEEEPDEARRAEMIWSHKWTLRQPFENQGVRAYAYFTAPENGRLGVFAHEYGHFLGLPDLYDTSYRSHGIGDWCLMAGGSWNGGGEQPARMSAWCLARLGWIRPTNVAKSKSLTLRHLSARPKDCYRLWTKGKSGPEYFLLENRQQQGRDSALPGHGLAVWHVDERQSDNSNPLAYRVGLVQADGRRDLEFNRNQGDPNDLFPGTLGTRSLTDTPAHPTTRSSDGSATGISVKTIKEKNGVVTCKVTV